MKQKHEKILNAVMQSLALEGWTSEAFDHGMRRAKASPKDGCDLFPHGVDSVAEVFHEFVDETMLARIASKRMFRGMRVRDKITFGIRCRFEIMAPYRDAIKRFLLWSLHPKYFSQAFQRLWKTADRLWTAAGDQSTDYNYYTKRFLLIAVLKTTLAFWLQDKSKDHEKTWMFLDRRIADVMKIGKGMTVIKTLGFSDIVSFVRSRFTA
jgi:ubiquinone biosynthesis protein COQ9